MTVLVTTRNEEVNLERCLASVRELADQICVLDSESSDGTLEIAMRWADQVESLTYEHERIIPWIFQWGLDNLPIRNEWVLILEADQAVPEALASEIRALVTGADVAEDGFFIRRIQIFRGKRIRWGGYGGKRLSR